MKKLISNLYFRWAYSQLARVQAEQHITFASLRDEFTSTYNLIKAQGVSSFVSPLWQSVNAEVERLFTPAPSFDFLTDPILRHQMFVEAGGKWLEEQLSFLEGRISRSRLRFFLLKAHRQHPTFEVCLSNLSQ